MCSVNPEDMKTGGPLGAQLTQKAVKGDAGYIDGTAACKLPVWQSSLAASYGVCPGGGISARALGGRGGAHHTTNMCSV